MIKDVQQIENSRIQLQVLLDSAKTALERNKLGQFATPPALSKAITKFVLEHYLENEHRIKFLEPAFGTGSFYSSLMSLCKNTFIEKAVAIEYDKDFFNAAKNLWKDTGIQIINDNFIKWNNPCRFNLVLTNPPYVRHHYIDDESKAECRLIAAKYPQLSISGLSGLYVYFMIHSISFMQENGFGVWLIPSEWMNVNYGRALRNFLTKDVRLLHIHNYSITDVKFEDALVSSSVVIFTKAIPDKDSICKLTYGTDINVPSSTREIPVQELRVSNKWLNFFNKNINSDHEADIHFPRLGDFFHVKRGIATGSNDFFIKPKQVFKSIGISSDFIKPILPPSRVLKSFIIESDRQGYPKIENTLAILDTNIPISSIKTACPELFSYLTSEKATEVSTSYLASHRTPWYSQEQRPPAPFLCTYMGRNGTNKKIFKFFYNKSKATATNGYLLLIPRQPLADYLKKNPGFSSTVLDFLNSIPDQQLISSGRNYGGGLYKMEPKELSSVNASFISEFIGVPKTQMVEQLSLFSFVQEPSKAYRSHDKKHHLRTTAQKIRHQFIKETGAERQRKNKRPPPEKRLNTVSSLHTANSRA